MLFRCAASRSRAISASPVAAAGWCLRLSRNARIAFRAGLAGGLVVVGLFVPPTSAQTPKPAATPAFLVVVKKPQSIAFPGLPARSLGTAPFPITATSASGLPVAFTTNAKTVCTVSGTTVTLLFTGTCSLTASQSGNGTYAAAAPVTQTFSVLAKNQPVPLSETAFVTVSLANANGYGHLTALNTTTGGTLWDYAYANPISGPFVGPDQTAYVLSRGNNGGFLTAVNPSSGTVKWTTEVATGNFAIYGPVFSSGALFVTGDSTVGLLSAINPQNGNKLWTYQSSGIMTRPVLGPDGSVYVEAAGGIRLIALNPQNGSVKWTYTVPVGSISDPTFGTDGTVYITSFADGQNGTANLTAIIPQNGTKKWNFSAGDTLFTTPVIGRDGTIYALYSARGSGLLAALNPQNGGVKWSYAVFRNDTSKFVLNTPVFATDGTVYLTAWSNSTAYLVALGPQTGTVKWNYGVGNTTKISGPVVAASGSVYFTSHTNGTDTIMAVNSQNGAREWEDAFGSSLFGPLFATDGTIYVVASSFSSNQGTVYVTALNPQTGSSKWNYIVANGAFTINKPIFGPDGSVYLSVLDGIASCFSFNPQSGKKNWQYLTGNALSVVGPVVE